MPDGMPMVRSRVMENYQRAVKMLADRLKFAGYLNEVPEDLLPDILENLDVKVKLTLRKFQSEDGTAYHISITEE